MSARHRNDTNGPNVGRGIYGFLAKSAQRVKPGQPSLPNRPPLRHHVSPDLTPGRRPTLVVSLRRKGTGLLPPDHQEGFWRSRAQVAHLSTAAVASLPASKDCAMLGPGQGAHCRVPAVIPWHARPQVLLHSDALIDRRPGRAERLHLSRRAKHWLIVAAVLRGLSGR